MRLSRGAGSGVRSNAPEFDGDVGSRVGRKNKAYYWLTDFISLCCF